MAGDNPGGNGGGGNAEQITLAVLPHDLVHLLEKHIDAPTLKRLSGVSKNFLIKYLNDHNIVREVVNSAHFINGKKVRCEFVVKNSAVHIFLVRLRAYAPIAFLKGMKSASPGQAATVFIVELSNVDELNKMSDGLVDALSDSCERVHFDWIDDLELEAKLLANLLV
ncbi:hypothetical protein PMAYCL1PPCAC_20353, partial [Pristionchus mayeri]